MIQEYRHADKFKYLDRNRLANGNMDFGKFEEFIEAKDRIPSTVADAEYRYMKMLRQDEAHHASRKGEPYLEFAKN